MIVLVSVSVVTVLSLALLQRQQSETSLSDNLEARVNARFAAESGVELAAAIMESPDVDWRAAHVNGVLIDNYDFGGGTITVRVIGEDGNPPSEDSESVMLESNASKGNLRNRRKAIVYAPKVCADADVDLSEFTLYASESILVQRSRIGRVANSPAREGDAPIRFGVVNAAAGAITVTNASRIVDGVIIAPRSAPAGMVSVSADSSEVARSSVLESESIPIPAAPSPTMTGYGAPTQATWTIGAGEYVIPDNRWFDQITVRWDARLLPGSECSRALIRGNLAVKSGGTIRITRDVDLIVQGGLWLASDAAIEVVPPARLRLFVGGDVVVEGLSMIGIARDEFTEDQFYSADTEKYLSPDRCTMYKIPGTPRAAWVFSGSSGVCGRIYAPNADVTILNGAGVRGNVVAATIELGPDARMLWDPALDDHCGYTAQGTPLITEANELIPALSGLTDLNDSTLTTLTNALLTDILAPGGGGSNGDGDQDSHARGRKVVNFRWLEEDSGDASLATASR